MKKHLLLLPVLALLLLTACALPLKPAAPEPAPETAPETPPSAASEKVEPVEAGQGRTEPFTYGSLTLEISHVLESRTERVQDEGGTEMVDLPVFTCGPGAMLTVIDADMSDPTYSEDGQPHPQWGLYDVETDSRTKLTEGMEPVALDENTDAVYNLEASQFVLRFEYVK